PATAGTIPQITKFTSYRYCAGRLQAGSHDQWHRSAMCRCQARSANLFKAHGEIHRAYVLGERADGNVIHARSRQFAQCLVRVATRSLEFGAAVTEVDGTADGVEFEVVEHDDVGAGGQCLLELAQ